MFKTYFEKKLPDPTDHKRRMAMGKEASVVGIVINLALAAFKIAVGLLSGAISILADGLNNLMDLLSSAISLIGFHFGAMPADKNHPYGHARLEYLASFVVGLIIIFTGISLAKDGIYAIIAPEEMTMSWLAFAILVLSIGGKIFLYGYNIALGKRMDSELLIATGYDARGDVFATSAVILSLLVYQLLGMNIDGWIGLFVALLIIKSGWESVKDTVDTILGQSPDPEMIKEILKEIKSFPVALGVHDLIYHDYGATHRFLTLHVEVDSRGDLLTIHEDIDEIERYIEGKYHMDTTIHIDPIRIDDARSNVLYDYVKENLQAIHGALDLHDFRIVNRKDGLNLVFDVLVPVDMGRQIQKIDDTLKARIRQTHPEYDLIITYDMDYQELLEG